VKRNAKLLSEKYKVVAARAAEAKADMFDQTDKEAAYDSSACLA